MSACRSFSSASVNIGAGAAPDVLMRILVPDVSDPGLGGELSATPPSTARSPENSELQIVPFSAGPPVADHERWPVTFLSTVLRPPAPRACPLSFPQTRLLRPGLPAPTACSYRAGPPAARPLFPAR